MTTASKAKPQPKRRRGRPTTDEVADIEKLLLSIALQEFLEHGYGGASISRMVRKAGVSKTTLYSRFASKEAMFHAIVERQIEQLSPAELLNSGKGPIELREGLRRYACHMLNESMKGELLGVNRLMYAESHRFPELGKAATRRTQLGISRIAAFIDECAKREGFQCRDSRAVAELFILAIRGWYIDVMISNRRVTAKHRAAWVDQCLHVLMSSSSNW